MTGWLLYLCYPDGKQYLAACRRTPFCSIPTSPLGNAVRNRGYSVVSQPLARLLGLTMIEIEPDSAFNGTAVIIWLLVIVFISLLASILPARHATRISVRESLAYG
jgi:hypothetical protein